MDRCQIEKKAAHEVTVSLRTAKRQLAILRTMKLPEVERNKLIKTIAQIENELKLFKI